MSGLDAETKALMDAHDKHLKPLPSWQDELKKTAEGGIRVRSLSNIRNIIQHDQNLKGVLGYDEFADVIVKLRQSPEAGLVGQYWGDSDDALVRNYIDDRYDLLFSKENIADAVIAVAKNTIVNPVKARIETQEWDGKPRAESYFIDYIGAEDNHYTRTVTKVWFTGAIARVYHAGVKFEIVPILQGGQGIGKSTAARNLFPDAFNDTLKSMGKSKDDYQQLQGSWILELGELSALSKSDVELTKNFISSPSDTYRNSYGRYATPHPRKCVFIGTTNHEDYLKDATGERRFYPVKCGVTNPTKDVINPDENDILQVLAEAKHWYDNKEPLYFDRKTLNEARVYQENATVTDLTRDTISEFLEMTVPANWDSLSVSAKQGCFNHRNDPEGLPKWLQEKVKGDSLPLAHTTAAEIMAVLFDRTEKDYLKRGINADAKRIKLIMDNMDGWRKNEQLMIKGKRKRGYERNT
ncbi:virulence-associated E family protein [uncultured Secundilactobacillus sp.]|uniref:virulence-associated E family protein n=1 Tax=uncultured Secundilactobacillus sp. TaxID=2813935 RepID=UPI00258BDC37|nr:virulence-associated E family protein [uncultured Secundilactobacillus sp.]